MALQRKTSTKASGTQSVPLGNQRFFLEDLEALVASRTESGQRVTIKAGDKVADEISDLRDASKSELRSVKLECENPSMTVWLYGHMSEVTWRQGFEESENQEMEAAANKVVVGTRATQTYPAFWRLGSFWVCLILVLGAILGWFLFFYLLLAGVPTELFWSVLNTVWAVAAVVYFARRYSTISKESSTRIINAYRRDRRWGFRHRKAEWVISSVTGLVGLAIGIVVGRFIS